MASGTGPWTARLGARELVLEPERRGRGTFVARLLVDGEAVGEWRPRPGERRGSITGGGVHVTLRRGASGSLSEAAARPEDGGRADEVAFVPPPGTRQARLAELARERPALYASRHVALAAAKLAAGIIGVTALLALIPWPDAPDISAPDVPVPDIPWPDWTLPGWLEAIIGTSQWWAPILAAVAIAVGEARRRRRRTENEARATRLPDDQEAASRRPGRR